MCGWTPEGGPREVRSTGRGVLRCLGEMTVSLGRPYWGNYVSPTACAPSPSRASNQGHL